MIFSLNQLGKHYKDSLCDLFSHIDKRSMGLQIFVTSFDFLGVRVVLKVR